MQQTFLIPLGVALTQDPQPQNNPAPAEKRIGAGDPAPGGATGTQTPAGPQAAPPQQCGGELMYMLPLFLLLMYFMAIRPEQKRKKEAAAMMGNLRSGDTVVTIGGMHGIVHLVEDRTVVLRIDSMKITVDKSAIARVQRDDTQKPESK
jgi:preprotein translocase subunit YajC